MDSILVVEDDPQSAMLLWDFCEQEGCLVIIAATGTKARAALGGYAIALVLLDLRLPDVDGVELMREIRQGERPPDVIITTAYAGRESAIAAIEAGAAGYIVKPVEIVRLRALVDSLLEKRRLRAENAALYQRAEGERQRLKALYDVANRLASVQDCWQILDLIVREATRLLGVEGSAVRLVEGEDLVLRAWTESAAPFLTRRTLKIGEGLTGCVVQTGEPVAVSDLALDPRYDPTHKQAALVGRLLLSTLHTNDATAAVPRLIDMEIESFLLASTLTLVVGQRLVRRTCMSCRESFAPEASVLKALQARPDFETTIQVLQAQGVLRAGGDPLAGLRLFRGKGCPRCGGSGFRGRLGMFELFEVDAETRGLIMERQDGQAIRNAAIRRGMKTMFQDGIGKALLGETTLEEVFRVAL